MKLYEIRYFKVTYENNNLGAMKIAKSLHP